MDKTILLPYQRRWLADRGPRKIWLAARQTGKSFTIALEAVAEGLEARSANLILSASERQSREVMEKVLAHLRHFSSREERIVFDDTREEVRLPNGSRIISLPANPDTVRGFSGNVYLDEFAFHKDAGEIWRAMYPAVTRGYKLRVSSTPNGKAGSLFHTLWSQSGYSQHKTTIYDAVNEGLPISIDELKKGIFDPDSWAQEYECVFLDSAGAFISYELIASCESEEASCDLVIPPHPPLEKGGSMADPSFNGNAPFRSPLLLPDVSPLKLSGAKGEYPNPDRNSDGTGLSNAPGFLVPPFGKGGQGGICRDFYLGVDIGRKHDLTVFWLWQKEGDVFRTRMVRELRDTPFSIQRDFLYALLDGSFGIRITRTAIDSTGLGAQLAEETTAKFGPQVEAVTFSLPVKERLALDMRRALEERRVRIPISNSIREDFYRIRREATYAGHSRFLAERDGDGHADRFWAAALGIYAGKAPTALFEYESAGHRAFSSLRGF